MKQFETREECLAWIDTLSFQQIRNTLADYIMEQPTEKILITLPQLEKFFKVRGLRIENGTVTEEVRGKFSVGRGGRKDSSM